MAANFLEARQVAETLNECPFVVRNQSHAGGRSQGRDIKPAATLGDVEKMAQQMLGLTLAIPQTGHRLARPTYKTII